MLEGIKELHRERSLFKESGDYSSRDSCTKSIIIFFKKPLKKLSTNSIIKVVNIKHNDKKIKMKY
jgi:hypothetical protein